MISDEERREFAENLRHIAKQPPEWATSACAIAEVFDADYPLRKDSGELFDMLADLIDRPTTTRHGKFRTKHGRQTPCCEVCGYSIGDMRWGYCPKCGAVITDD